MPEKIARWGRFDRHKRFSLLNGEIFLLFYYAIVYIYQSRHLITHHQCYILGKIKMKMKQLSKTFTLAVLGVAAMMSQQVHGQAATISFSPNAFPTGSPNEADDQANGTVFSNIAGAVPISFGEGTAAAADFDPLELTADGFTGLFNVSVTLSSNNTTAGSPIQRGGVGAVGVFGGAQTLIDGDESLTVSDFVLDFVSGDDVFQFDGFSGVFLGNNQGALDRTAQVNGVLIPNLSTGSGGTSFTLAPIDLADSIEISGVTGGGLSLNGVQASFSVVAPEQPAVPEPSSALILVFAAFGCICKRRRS